MVFRKSPIENEVSNYNSTDLDNIWSKTVHNTSKTFFIFPISLFRTGKCCKCQIEVYFAASLILL